jgi:adenosylhomocysteine nucleosidase
MTIGIFAAMEVEVGVCPEWTRNGERSAIGGVTVIQGEGAFVCQTGIGREAATASAAAVLSQMTPTMALSVGLCGGLAPGVGVGDVVVCSHADHESHRHSDVEQSVYADQALFDAAIETGKSVLLPVRAGTSLTVDEAAWGPAEKAAQHAWKAHDIVEMESFWIGEAASRRGIPFLAVRAVSDASDDTLPNIGFVREDGSFDMEKALEYLREHPGTGEQLSTAAQKSKLALENLTAYLEAMLPRLIRVAAGMRR